MLGEDRPAAVRPVPGFWGATLPAVLALSAALAACDTAPPEPVASLTASPAEVELAYPRSAAVTAEWRMTAPLVRGAAEPQSEAWVFVHLLDASGAVVRTYDHPLPFSWSPGETRRSAIEVWQSALGPPLPPGDYELTVGLYQVGTGRRWPLAAEGPEVDEGEYRVARVRVPPASSGPEVVIEFRGPWQVHEGGDRQVLARRTLRNDGAIDISGLQGPVELQLGVFMPEPTGAERTVLLEGAERAELRVSSPCADEEEVLETPGYHRVALTLRAPADRRCTVLLEPSFVFVTLDSLDQRSTSLERLSLGPAAP
jgi:hypothetical protein